MIMWQLLKTLLLSLVFMPTLLEAQGWMKTFGEPDSSDWLKSVLPLEDGRSFVLSSLNLRLLSPSGEELWLKEYDNLIGERIEKREDGGFWLMGETRTFTNNARSILLIRLDETGTEVWRQDYSYELPDFPDSLWSIYVRDLEELDNGDLIIVGNTGTVNNPLIIRTNAEGTLQWMHRLNFDEYPNFSHARYPIELIQTSDGNFLMGGVDHSDIDFYDRHPFLIKFDGDGNMFWHKRYGITANFYTHNEKTIGIAETTDSNYIIGYYDDYTNNDISLGITKTDSDGNELWHHTYITDLPSFVPTDMVQSSNGDLFFIGGNTPFIEDSEHMLVRIDKDGVYQWQKTFTFHRPYETLNMIELTADHGFIMGGQFRENPEENIQDIIIVKTDSLGNSFSTALKGTVADDIDLNCLIDSSENRYANWMLKAEGEETFYGITDSAGNYLISLDTGAYQLSVLPPVPFWQTCTTDTLIQINLLGDTSTVDFPMEDTVSCPLLSVDISAPWLRRCFMNKYTVQYCNIGSSTADEAYIEVTLDPYLQVMNSSIPYTLVDGDTYTFPLGFLEHGDCGNFTIDVYLDCDSTVLGQTHCVEAVILPDYDCFDPDPLWDGASLVVDGICETDSVRFVVKNKGSDMSVPTPLLVVEDNVMLFQNQVQLLNQQEAEYAFEATGATYYLEVSQTPGHPGSDSASDVVEGCTEGDTFSTGFVNQFPQNDSAPGISIACIESIGSYDPNDKIGYPVGRYEEHLIEVNEDLEYKIRFQNTGTDTAFKVVILDTLSQYLNITSLRPGVSSHPYRLDILPNEVLQFTFDNIMLPDSNVNEAASHGFVNFKIDQQFNNALGSVILNSAAIYFDFNEPVITNTTFHTVGEKLLLIIQPDKLTTQSQEKVIAYPNPTKDIAHFKLQNDLEGTLEFQLFDAQGRVLRQENIKLENYQFNRRDLPAGIYFYRFKQDGRNIGTGRIIIQEANF
jgi:uncharacterized repeat protein (TIGR01451 family)